MVLLEAQLITGGKKSKMKAHLPKFHEMHELVVTVVYKFTYRDNLFYFNQREKAFE
jgi:hypothetical protein